MSSILYNIHRYVYMHSWICIISSWLCLTIVSFARAAWGYVKARGLDIMTIFENYKKAGQAPYGHVLVRSFWRVTRQIISSIPKLQLFFDLTTPWPAGRGHGWYQCESFGHQWPCNTVQGILRYSFWSDDSGSPKNVGWAWTMFGFQRFFHTSSRITVYKLICNMEGRWLGVSYFWDLRDHPAFRTFSGMPYVCQDPTFPLASWQNDSKDISVTTPEILLSKTPSCVGNSI